MVSPQWPRCPRIRLVMSREYKFHFSIKTLLIYAQLYNIICIKLHHNENYVILLIIETYLNKSLPNLLQKCRLLVEFKLVNLAVKLHSLRWRHEKTSPATSCGTMLKLAGIGPMLGRYKRANAGPIQAITSTFITVCPVYWLSTVYTVAGTNGTRQYNASIGPIHVCLLGAP